MGGIEFNIHWLAEQKMLWLCGRSWLTKETQLHQCGFSVALVSLCRQMFVQGVSKIKNFEAGFRFCNQQLLPKLFITVWLQARREKCVFLLHMYLPIHLKMWTTHMQHNLRSVYYKHPDENSISRISRLSIMMFFWVKQDGQAEAELKPQSHNHNILGIQNKVWGDKHTKTHPCNKLWLVSVLMSFSSLLLKVKDRSMCGCHDIVGWIWIDKHVSYYVLQEG